MAFTFTGGLTLSNQFDTEASDELNQFKELTSILRNLQIQESGFNQVTKTRSLEEGLQAASSSDKDAFEVINKSIEELKYGIGVAKQSKYGTIGGFGTTLGFRAGYGPGTFHYTELEKQLADIQKDKERLTNKLTNFIAFEKTPERLAEEAKLKEFQDQQEKILRLQAERQEKALKGELPLSESLKEKKQQEFRQFKEAQARIGNVVEGETLEDAAAKGTGATTALERFRSAVKQAEDAERRGEIFGGAQIFQGSLGQVPTLGPGFAGVLPNVASPFGIQAVNLASQPFFQQQQIGLQRQALEAQLASSGRGGSGLLSGAIGGGLSGAAIGTQIAPGYGTLFGGIAGAGLGLLAGSSQR